MGAPVPTGTVWANWARTAAAIALILPPALYIAFVVHYGVSVPYQDDWSLVPLLADLHHGVLTLGSLWAQHLQNHVFFPNLLMVGLLAVSHFNTRLEMWVGAAFLVAAFLLFAWGQTRLSGRAWGWMLPAAFLCFSLIQYHTALHGYAISLYLIALAALAAMAALVRSESPGTAVWVVLAGLGAIVASYSSLQGMAVWPAGMVLLSARGRRPQLVLGWALAGAATAAVYLVGFRFGAGGSAAGWALHHPITSLGYFVLLAAGVVPQSHQLHVGEVALTAIGALVWVLGAVVILRALRSRGRGQAAALSAALIAMVAAIDLLTTLGRAQTGLGLALAPRYTVFNLWLWAAVYLGLLEPLLGTRRRRWRLGIGTVLALLWLLQVGGSVHGGLQLGRELRSQHLTEINLVLHYRTAAPAQIYRYALQDTRAFKPLARELAILHLSVFHQR